MTLRANKGLIAVVMGVAMKKVVSYIIAVVLLVTLQYYIINQHMEFDMNTSLEATQTIKTHLQSSQDLDITIKEEPKETFASFIGIPNFYIKHGHHSSSTNNNLLTICSICSLDIVQQARPLATNYGSGPISLAVYIDEDITYHTHAIKTKLFQLFDAFFHNISTSYDLTIGLLYINKSCPFWRNLPITNTTTMDWKLPYNALRNLAEHQVHTKWLMTVDLDFKLYSSTIHNGAYLNTILTNAGAYSDSNHTIFIVPAFAINTSYVEQNSTDYNNLTRTQLMSLIPHQILPFKYHVTRGQDCTHYSKWYTAQTDYTLNTASCAANYEPYFIMNSNISREYAWDSRFVGRQLDKVQRLQFLRYLKFTSIVMRDLFMIHVNQPHKHRGSGVEWKHRQINNCLIAKEDYFLGNVRCKDDHTSSRFNRKDVHTQHNKNFRYGVRKQFNTIGVKQRNDLKPKTKHRDVQTKLFRLKPWKKTRKLLA
eukprot:550008_1